MMEVDTLVIGAGPAGLSFAYHLGGDTLVLEKEDEVGGLCRSIEQDGGVFDIGGHSFHSPHPEVHELVRSLMGDRWFTQRRDARVFSHDVLIPYPFQKNYDQIPDREVVRACEEGLASAESAPDAADFEEYIIRRFGAGVAEHFMLPYNRKLWARDLKEISCEWTSQRVAEPKGAREEKFQVDGGERKPLQPDTVVGYPAEGGFVEIYRALARDVRVRTGEAVTGIDPARRVAFTSSGQEIAWGRLVSTMPLPLLLDMTNGVPRQLVASARQLQYMSLDLLLLLIDDALPDAPQRIYVADPEVPPHKIAFNHTSSDALRARPVHAIMAEISYSPTKPRLDPAEAEARTVRFLADAGILASPDQVRWSRHVDVEYAYPVYTHTHADTVAAIKRQLTVWNMFTLGRFGEWEYINSDKCLKKGMDLAARVGADPTMSAARL